METKEYSSNVIRTLNPKSSTSPNTNWEESKYESKTTRNILDSPDHQLASTNFIRQAQTNYSTRSNYSTKSSASNREFIDDAVLNSTTATPYQQRQKVITTTTKNYSTSGGGNPVGNISTSSGGSGVEALDELLDDLKNERSNSEFNDYSYKYSNSSTNIPVIQSHQQKRSDYTTKSVSSSNLIDTAPQFGGTTVRRTERIDQYSGNGGPPSVQRTKHVEVLNSKSLESVSPQPPHIIIPPNATNTSTSETVVKRDILTSSDLKEIPIGETITDDLLPLPGTKVTTTVRTYTYEVPSVVTRHNVLYHDDLRTDLSLPPPARPITPVTTSTLKSSTINKNYSENVTNINDNYTTTRTHIDNRIINGKLPSDNPQLNGYPPHIHDLPPHQNGGPPTQTYYYKREVHNTKNTVEHPPQPLTYVNQYHETNVKNTNTTTNRYPPHDVYPPPGTDVLRPISPASSTSPVPPPSVTYNTYITKTTTTSNDYPDSGPQQPLSRHPRDVGPYPGPGGQPPYIEHTQVPPVTQTYYRTHEKTTSSTMPFPTDNVYPIPDNSAQPPKKVNELLEKFDDTDGDADEIKRKKELDLSVATPDKNRVSTTNKAGPPVYYPPNSELTLRSKEGGGAWRAQGGYAAAAGGSEYYAESSSKSKSKSGAAVVPVCLPLCCAMPCVIM